MYKTDDDNVEISIKVGSVDDDTNIVGFTKKNVIFFVLKSFLIKYFYREMCSNSME